MAAALGTYSSVSTTKAFRVEGHTSNVEVPVTYVQYGQAVIAETTESGDTYILPHKITNPAFITLMPNSATGVTFCSAVSFPISGTAVAWTQITTVATAGATSVVLTGASAIDDVYNNLWIDIRYSNGNLQTVKVTDYVGSTKVASLDSSLEQSIAATGTYYRIRGTVLTTTGAAATPTFSYKVEGTFAE